MKILGRNRTPEDRLREAVEAGQGAIEMRASDLLRAHGLDKPTAAAGEHVHSALLTAGLVVRPPLQPGYSEETVQVVRQGAVVGNGQRVPEPEPVVETDPDVEGDAIDEAIDLAVSEDPDAQDE